MPISSLGVGSGLDAESIVQKLVALQKQPLQALQSAKSDLDANLSSYGQIQSYLSALQDAARGLTDLSTWRAATVSTSDSTAVSATVQSGTPPGSYSITVSHLAKAQSIATATHHPSAGASIGEGTLTIDIGRYTNNGSTFTPKAGSNPLTITIGPEDNTLSKIAEKINGAGGGVLASIVRDTNGYRLSIRSRETGEENAFRISATNAQDENGDDIGNLAQLAYGTGASSDMELKQASQNAKALINNLEVESGSNTLSNVMDGLSLTLNRTFATPVEVTVGTDTAAIRTAVTNFQSNFNTLVGYLRKQTAYNGEGKKAGPLQGERTAIALVAQLRNLASGSGGSSSLYSRLTDIGLEPQKDGTLKLSGSTLDKAIANLADLKNVLSNQDDAVPARNGIGQRFKNYLSGLLDTAGPLQGATEGLNARIKNNQAQQDALSKRASAYEARIRAQYQALDAQMGQLQGLSAYVSQQMSLLNKR